MKLKPTKARIVTLVFLEALVCAELIFFFHELLTSVKLCVRVFCIRIFVTCVLCAMLYISETNHAVLSSERCQLNSFFMPGLVLMHKC